MASPIEMQHSGHRILTPIRFADWLVSRVRTRYSVKTVAALYVAMHGPYPRMRNVQCWPVLAELYGGPYPIVAHPPCGPWGPCWTLCTKQRAQCGIDAIELVHRWGGVIEQPIGSALFDCHGRKGSVIEVVNQHDFGHKVDKPTLLYWPG